AVRSAHLHAKMPRLDDHADSHGLKLFHEHLGYLVRHAFLHLEPTCEDLDDLRDFRKSDDFSIRNISDARLAEEREQMVLAEAVNCNVFDEDHLAVFHIEERPVDELVNVYA